MTYASYGENVLSLNAKYATCSNDVFIFKSPKYDRRVSIARTKQTGWQGTVIVEVYLKDNIIKVCRKKLKHNPRRLILD